MRDKVKEGGSWRPGWWAKSVVACYSDVTRQLMGLIPQIKEFNVVYVNELNSSELWIQNE